VPYRLSEVLASPLVYLVEGEKDVETLRKRDLPATCAPMGAGKWRDEYNEFLRGKTVIILPDNDEPGRKHALQAASSLHGIATEIVIVELPNLPPKGDVTDFFKNGGTVDEMVGLIERANAWQPDESAEAETATGDIDETPIEVKLFPQPNEKCFHGLAGKFVRFIEPHTEADRMAILIQFLVYFGNIIGRSAYFQVEGDRHFTNLFCVLVGDTASGRKGTSFGRVKEIFKDLDETHQKECIVSGLASGEGLLYHVRDAQYVLKKNKDTGELEDILIDAGISDKRLLITEGEFANVLRVQGRDGNTLSALIRNFWDSGNARSLTKNSPLKTTDAHVSIIGHITKTELLACLTEVESANGYANRFLWLYVRRSKLLPLGSKVDYIEFLSINAEISRRIDFARNIEQLDFSDEAKEIWASIYEHLETSRFGFVAKVTQRASPYVLRLSCIFAVLDKKTVIEREHLEAALAVWQYCEDSAKYIFGDSLGNKNADLLLNALREAENGLTRTEIYNDVFQKNVSAKQIRQALQLLIESDLIESRTEQTENARKPSEKWFVKNSGLRI
jgi:hypothetical protein